jgi:chromosome segregation ATPase
MTSEITIQAEVEGLRAQFADTRALYREVCALLFFRHGITPTASKLYQYVRKGSMGTPAEVLAQFWEEMRSKAKVEIEHPGLPEALRQAAGEAMNTLWQQASAQAREELTGLREEAQAETQALREQLALERGRVGQLNEQAEALRAHESHLQGQLQAVRDDLEVERRNHSGARARGLALEQQLNELKQELSSSRAHFSAEIDKAQAAVELAVQRGKEAEHRAMREIDQERQARAGAEKLLETARLQHAEVERRHQAVVLEQGAEQARLTAAVQSAQVQSTADAHRIQAQELSLQHALEASAAHKAEAQTLRSLMERFKPAAKRARRQRAEGTGAENGPSSDA